ncbi:hypothetical protein LCGC14_0632240 [marine sediment metagenome]|uniref:Uncharacterized protein n=1 Tax=marine sediment metagenome TaxID=412755 RepID=A0A0F9R6W3_9ZZZZ
MIEWKSEGNKITQYGAGTIAVCPSPQNGGVFEFTANTQLIVKAVNCHDDMVEALKAALDFFTQYDMQQKVISGISLQLNEALAKADGK